MAEKVLLVPCTTQFGARPPTVIFLTENALLRRVTTADPTAVLYLHNRRDIDRVPRCSCGRKGCLGLRRVSQGIVYPRLDEMRLHKELLVVHALQLPEELVQQCHGVLVPGLLE